MGGTIRLARQTDARRMLAIYEPLVRETATAGEFRRRIHDTLEVTPWLACEADGEIMGYAYAGRLRPREAYQWSVEVTVYVNADFRRRGVGAGPVHVPLRLSPPPRLLQLLRGHRAPKPRQHHSTRGSGVSAHWRLPFRRIQAGRVA